MKKLNKQTLQAIAYAQNAISFIFLNPEAGKAINGIYLFGSAVRSELTSESDIDIFIDCDIKKEELIERLSKVAISNFYRSKDFEKWKVFKFNYSLSIKVGNLKTWHLKSSIMSEGILLYSKKIGLIPSERMVLFVYTLPKNKKAYLHFIRLLYGRTEEGYKGEGLLKDINGRKISTNVFIVPKENQQIVMKFMQKEKIDYSMKEICVFE